MGQGPPPSPVTVGPTGWVPSQGVAFRFLLAARLCSVFFMHISDCDETFNYWEPFHYIIYGSGFQTWEYSPAYALRSYSYILLHVLPMLLTRMENKLMVFFLLRIVLAAFCTLCEFYFYKAVLVKFGPRVAKWMLLFLVCGCGMFVASSAFLPSSFSMALTMVALGAWFLQNNGLAIFAIALSAIVGWPFSAALGIPIAVDLLFNRKSFLHFILWSFISLLLIAVPLVVVDSIYYGKLVCPPLNIIMYNVLGKGGPTLYGVEPWTFYFVNGFLNFNIAFLLALLAIPLMELKILSDAAAVTSSGKASNWMQRLFSILFLYSGRGGSSLPSKGCRPAAQSMLIWIIIFFTRPHKEERFLFPIFPLFCLNAAVALVLLPDVTQAILRCLGTPRSLKTSVRSLLDWLPSITAVLYVLLSFSRVTALYKGYHAPLDVYTHLSSGEMLTIVRPISGSVNVCVGKEWYRYPSSFYLPAQPGSSWQLKFIRSGFRGQLPKPYSSHRNATWTVPEAMNDVNREEPSRYFDVDDCHFLVDLATAGNELEPCYVCDDKNWHVVVKYPFLDVSRSHQLFRAFYVPFLSESNTVYTDYVLLLHKPKFKKL